jgi:hypothetical protein
MLAVAALTTVQPSMKVPPWLGSACLVLAFSVVMEFAARIGKRVTEFMGICLQRCDMMHGVVCVTSSVSD